MELAQEDWENFDGELAAISLSALLDGLWLDPDSTRAPLPRSRAFRFARPGSMVCRPAVANGSVSKQAACRRAAVDRLFSNGYSLALMQKNTLIRNAPSGTGRTPSHDATVLDRRDDPLIRELLHAYLSQGYEVHCAATAELAETFLASQTVDLVMLDIRLPGKDGLTLTRELRVRSEVGIILITGRNEKSTASSAWNAVPMTT
jgi:CheY-like chemotaxis protein